MGASRGWIGGGAAFAIAGVGFAAWWWTSQAPPERGAEGNAMPASNDASIAAATATARADEQWALLREAGSRPKDGGLEASAPRDAGDAAARDAALPEVPLPLAADAAALAWEGPYKTVARYCAEFQRNNASINGQSAGPCSFTTSCTPGDPLAPAPPAPWKSARLVETWGEQELLALETAAGTFVVDAHLQTSRCDDSVSRGTQGGFDLVEDLRLSSRVDDAGAGLVVLRYLDRDFPEQPRDESGDVPKLGPGQPSECMIVCRAGVGDGGPACVQGCADAPPLARDR